jgi:hypothetical protein
VKQSKLILLISSILLLLTIALLTLSAKSKSQWLSMQNAEAAACNDTAAFSKEILKRVKKPTTLVEIAQNTKLVLDNHLLLSDCFYSDENLKQVFGGENISWVENNSQNKSGYVNGYSAIIEPIPFKGIDVNTWDAIDVFFGKTISKSRKLKAHIFVQIRRETDLSYEKIEEIFGKDWDVPQQMLTGHEGFEYPTKPNGNARIEKRKIDKGVSQITFMMFSPDATLAYIDIEEEKIN